jgi:hypothetical protein
MPVGKWIARIRVRGWGWKMPISCSVHRIYSVATDGRRHVPGALTQQLEKAYFGCDKSAPVAAIPSFSYFLLQPFSLYYTSIQDLIIFVKKFQKIASRQPVVINTIDAALAALLFFATSCKQKPAIRQKNSTPSCISPPI